MKTDKEFKVGDLVKVHINNKGMLKGKVIFVQMYMYLVEIEGFLEPVMFGAFEMQPDIETLRENKLEDLLD